MPRPTPVASKSIARAAAALAAALGLSASGAAGTAAEPAGPDKAAAERALAPRLEDTGLFVAGSTTRIAPGIVAFSPQYPLWSDGATKRRWMRLPPGTSIDASQPDAWQFPPGTKLWKEFSMGPRIETRLIERLDDGAWRFAAYVWNEEGTTAALAPSAGIAALPVADAPAGRYAVPSQDDCRACHDGAATPVLGFSALQLSSDRDAQAPHAEPAASNAATLRELVARGWLHGLDPALLEKAPRIAAESPVERAALGYLHGNCGHCHNDSGAQPPVGLLLAQRAAGGVASVEKSLHSMLGARSRYRAPGLPKAAPIVTPGQPDASVLVARMRSRNPQMQMPPLGTQRPDDEGLALVERWIAQQALTPKEPAR